MSELVRVALAEDVTEAEETQAILGAAGTEAMLEAPVDHHPTSTELRARANVGSGDVSDGPFGGAST